MIRDNEQAVPNIITPQHVLLSVFDKTGLPELVDGLATCNPDIHMYSTGGTGKVVEQALAGRGNYTPVDQWTQSPEMEGGLVKTLHPKVFGGLLGERGNEEHQMFFRDAMTNMTGTPGAYIDLAVVNFYPFTDVVVGGANTEQARGNIDIGGPSMAMAAAKNWHSCTALTHPSQYETALEKIRANGGIPVDFRFGAATVAMRLVSQYRSAIANHFGSLRFSDVAKDITLE